MASSDPVTVTVNPQFADHHDADGEPSRSTYRVGD